MAPPIWKQISGADQWPNRIAADSKLWHEQVLEGASQTGLVAAGDGNGLQALSEILEGVLALDAKAATASQASYSSLCQVLSSVHASVGTFRFLCKYLVALDPPLQQCQAVASFQCLSRA